MTLPTPYPTPYPALYPTPYPTLYDQYPQPHQFNTFTNQGESNKATPGNTMDTILDQIAKLLASRKATNHQLHEVQVATPTTANIWDMTNTPESLPPQEGQFSEVTRRLRKTYGQCECNKLYYAHGK